MIHSGLTKLASFFFLKRAEDEGLLEKIQELAASGKGALGEVGSDALNALSSGGSRVQTAASDAYDKLMGSGVRDAWDTLSSGSDAALQKVRNQLPNGESLGERLMETLSKKDYNLKDVGLMAGLGLGGGALLGAGTAAYLGRDKDDEDEEDPSSPEAVARRKARLLGR